MGLLRALAAFFVGLMLVRALRWFLAGRSTARPSGAPSGAQPARGERMVRDRVCGTFVPERAALRLDRGSDPQFFCSAACRDKALAKPV